jgi:hypothetical protein
MKPKLIEEDPFPVEKGVPIPLGRDKYPWERLDVGDSFFVPGKTLRSLATQTSYAGKRFGRRFRIRLVDGGVRIWRIE